MVNPYSRKWQWIKMTEKYAFLIERFIIPDDFAIFDATNTILSL